MKKLATVLEKIENGSETVVRENLDTALGLWGSAHGTATQVVAVSESSVAFVDEKTNMWVSNYSNNNGVIALTDMRKVLNVNEEESKVDFLQGISEQIVKAVVENREEEATDLVGLVLEYKTKVIRKGKMLRINDPIVRTKNFRKMSAQSRWNIVQAARKTARKIAYKGTKAIRQAKSAQKRSTLLGGKNTKGATGHKSSAKEGQENKGKALLEALDNLVPTAINLMVALEDISTGPVIEGHIIEAYGNSCPKSMKTKKSKKPVKVRDAKDDEERADENITERVHSTGIKVPVTGVEGVPDGEYEIQKANSRSCHLLSREGKKPKTHTVKTSDLKRALRAAGKKSKVEDLEDKVDEAIEYTNEHFAPKPAVVVNLNAIKESFSTKDWVYRTSFAWEQFRADPISEDSLKGIKENDAAAIVKGSPFLLLCNEGEVFDAIEPHMESIDPNEITDLAKQITALAESEDGKQHIAEFLYAFNDEELSECLVDVNEGESIAMNLDAFLIEADRFDFGSADDMGSDDLGDDYSQDQNMGDEDGDLEDDLGLDDMDDMDDGMEEENLVTIEMDADQLRSNFGRILDIIADEIEENEEFEELRQRIEDPETEISSADVQTVLSTINDYFKAIGKDADDSQEQQDQDRREGETLDDMDDMGDDPPADDLDGDASDMGGGEDDFDLGM